MLSERERIVWRHLHDYYHTVFNQLTSSPLFRKSIVNRQQPVNRPRERHISPIGSHIGRYVPRNVEYMSSCRGTPTSQFDRESVTQSPPLTLTQAYPHNPSKAAATNDVANPDEPKYVSHRHTHRTLGYNPMLR